MWPALQRPRLLPGRPALQPRQLLGSAARPGQGGGGGPPLLHTTLQLSGAHWRGAALERRRVQPAEFDINLNRDFHSLIRFGHQREYSSLWTSSVSDWSVSQYSSPEMTRSLQDAVKRIIIPFDSTDFYYCHLETVAASQFSVRTQRSILGEWGQQCQFLQFSQRQI